MLWYLEESMDFHGKLVSKIITVIIITINVIIYNWLEQRFGHIKIQFTHRVYLNLDFISFSIEQKPRHLSGIHCFYVTLNSHIQCISLLSMIFFTVIIYYTPASSNTVLAYSSLFSFLTYPFLTHSYIFFSDIFYIFPVLIRISRFILFG